MPVAQINIETLQAKFEQQKINPNCFLIRFENHALLPKEPYRTNCYGICLLHQGSVSLKTNLINHSIVAPACIAMGPHVIRNWNTEDELIVADVVFFTAQFLGQETTAFLRMSNYSFFDNELEHVLKMNDPDYQKIKVLFENVQRIQMEHSNRNKESILKNYIAILINELDNCNKTSGKGVTHFHNNTVIDFKKLLSEHLKKERNVQFYADHLHTTSKYLSEQIKKYSGKSAKEYIDAVVLLEIKIMLQNPKLNIVEIATEFHFPNPSFFGKFFKKHTGFSPKKYKNSLEQ